MSATKTTVAYGQAVLVTAAVASGQGASVPSGKVTFSAGATTVATAALDATGKVTVPLPLLAVGSPTITAAYSGDAGHKPSTGSLVLTITRASSSTKLTASKNPAAFGDQVTVTAAVTGAAGAVTPTGTVHLTEGHAALGSGTLKGGKATIALPKLPVGTHALAVSYSGDGSYNASTAALVLVIAKAATRTVLTASPNPAASRTTLVTLKARVTSVAGIPRGTVTFTDGSRLLGRVSSASDGTATLKVSSWTVGSHHLKATFSGASSYASSSGTTTLTIRGPSLSLTASVRSLPAGQKVTLTGHGTSLAKPAVTLIIVEFHGSSHRTVATCHQLTACAVSLTHSAGSWTYRVIATDSSGKSLLASPAVTVTWK
jgi:hypothetical protein